MASELGHSLLQESTDVRRGLKTQHEFVGCGVVKCFDFSSEITPVSISRWFTLELNTCRVSIREFRVASLTTCNLAVQDGHGYDHSSLRQLTQFVFAVGECSGNRGHVAVYIF